MKYVRPIYKALNKVDSELAVKTFLQHRSFYHPICASMVAKDLGVWKTINAA
jgi:leukotriene-A4 hydrolase